MKQFTIIWEDRWHTGNLHHCMTKKTWIECNDVSEIMNSSYGERVRYIFDGFQITEGETFDSTKVVSVNDEDFFN